MPVNTATPNTAVLDQWTEILAAGPNTGVLRSTGIRTSTPIIGVLRSTGIRTATTTAVLRQTSRHTLDPNTAVVQRTVARIVSSNAAVLHSAVRQVTPNTASVQATSSRSLATTAVLLQTLARSIGPMTGVLTQTSARSVLATGVLVREPTGRTTPNTAVLFRNTSRTILTNTGVLAVTPDIVNLPSYNRPTSIVTQGVLMDRLFIRDTNNHGPDTNEATENTFLADCRIFAGIRLLYVENFLNQAVSVTLLTSLDGEEVNPVGTSVTIDADKQQWIDPASYTNLSYPYPYIGVRLHCTVAPTIGYVTVNLCVAGDS